MAQQRKARQTSHWGELWSALSAMFPKIQSWRPNEQVIFFEIEAILHLYERLVPAADNRPPTEAWALVSGYCSGTINAALEARQMCLLLRERLVYVRTASAWRWWLAWYA
ncbi:MAG: hypothetical protein IT324_06910, partial [Anaerolineae bacterium]|nr:hypothetical protein [Anaerolineae bacterium]